MMQFESGIRGRVVGRLRVVDVRSGLFIVDEQNSITDYSANVIRGLLARNPEDFLIDFIAIGLGGDAEILPPHGDTGARVAPDPSEETMRILLEEIPIQTTKETGDEIEYTALVRPDQAVSDDINEFGLVTRSGKLFAHYVTDAAPVRAEKKPKTDIYWILKWIVDYTNA